MSPEWFGPVATIGGTIGGRKLSDGQEGVGTIGLLDHKARTKAARAFYPEGRSSDFSQRDQYFVDEATGALFVKVDGDPLLSARPQDAEVAVFFVRPDGAPVFLRRPGRGPATVADLDAQAAEKERADTAVVKERADWLAAQPRRPLMLSQVRTSMPLLSVRDAARVILDSGGAIGRGPFGELSVQMPEQLVHPDAGVTRPLMERSAWDEIKTAASTLAAAEHAVLAAIDKAGKRRLDAVLPDGFPTVGGGVA